MLLIHSYDMKIQAKIFLILLGLYACGPQQKQQVDKKSTIDQKLADVMEIHDEVMPEMETIYSLNKKMKSKIDSLKSVGTATTEIERFQRYSARLETAEKAMMDWMHNSVFQFEGVSEDSAMMILDRQEQEIIEVKKQMLQSIDSAEAVL